MSSKNQPVRFLLAPTLRCYRSSALPPCACAAVRSCSSCPRSEGNPSQQKSRANQRSHLLFVCSIS